MGAKILFVDDTRLMRRNAELALAGAGYQPVVAGDGAEGLAVLANEYQNVKLIFTDWNMPKMDGYQLLVEVKKDERYKHIPIIMVTSESEKAQINKALEAGAIDYIIKPFANDDLIAKARGAIGG
jgi:two-component system chemotaxis response regulator CheY